jgi:hypothetical protein
METAHKVYMKTRLRACMSIKTLSSKSLYTKEPLESKPIYEPPISTSQVKTVSNQSKPQGQEACSSLAPGSRC